MRNLFAYIGKRLINATTPKKLLAVLRRARERGTLSVAHEALRHIGRIFRYAVIAGRVPPPSWQDFPCLRGGISLCSGPALFPEFI